MPKPSWIEFKEVGDTGKTKVWAVVVKGDPVCLGHVKWFGRWRKYSYFPQTSTVYEATCLRDIANFCEEQTALHRKARKEARCSPSSTTSAS